MEKSRCSFVYQGLSISPLNTISQAVTLIIEFRDVSSLDVPSAMSLSSNRPFYWSPPPVHYVLINCDAAWDLSTSKAGLGVIARDHGGACIGGLAIPSLCASIVIAESEAVLAGVTLARDLKLAKVIISSDSKYSSSSSSW
ncbi:hypothetical protein M0R45_026128 [Rubus argutus]|uniref:RNase H type-1 domain-containing protein n=1 Tax=Rubus argutus TaxID=59490 RepID=A0AAW1WWQ7_RUBAR